MKSGGKTSGVTLVEMLVSIAVLAVLMVIIFQTIQLAGGAFKHSAGTKNVAQQTRDAFERMTRQLSQATLNTYFTYYPAPPAKPTNYIRQSELQFLSGYGPSPTAGPTQTFVTGQITHAVFFQAPLGVTDDQANYGNLNNLLNACGYYVIYGKDPTRPTFLSGLPNAPPDEYRYRLMEFLPPSESLGVYTAANFPNGWIAQGISAGTTAAPTTRVLASNIVALIILPEKFSAGTTTTGQANIAPVTTSAQSYNYDSTQGATSFPQPQTANELPPLVKVIMVAIDEASGIKLAAANGTATPNLGQSTLFQNPDNLFTAAGVEGDLDKFQDILSALPGNIAGNKIKLTYSVFQTDLAIRESKWSN